MPYQIELLKNGEKSAFFSLYIARWTSHMDVRIEMFIH